MPSALFVCPHCEKHAEVLVTSVTRSRPCPHCSELVVLQVACKDRKSKRRALLVSAKGTPVFTDDSTLKSVPGPVYDPQPLAGEVFERMKMDPEIQMFRRRFFIGVSIVATMILGAVVWHYVPSSSPENSPVAITRTPVAENAPPAAAPLPKNAVGLRYSSGQDDAKSKSMLTFQTVEETMASTESEPRKAALSVAEQFLHATTAEEALKTIADASSIEKPLRDYFAARPASAVPEATLAIDSSSQDKDGHWCVNASFKDGSKKQIHIVLDHGSPRVDWPSYVAWSAMDWAKFMVSKPSDATLFRVLAEDDARYERSFSDSRSLRCVRLVNPSDHSARPLYAYVDRQSVVGSEIDFLMRQSTEKPVKLTLRIKYPADPMSDDQVWIENVITSGWVFRELHTTAQVEK